MRTTREMIVAAFEDAHKQDPTLVHISPLKECPICNEEEGKKEDS